jgi:hypothetical protein
MEVEHRLETLRALNPGLNILPVSHPDFSRYGCLIDDPGIPALLAYLRKHTPVSDGSAYTASDAGAEALPVFESLRRRFFGGLNIQLGWCNGTNTGLNALEYHASVELDVAASDAVLLLARRQDMVNGAVDTSAVRGFYLQKGQAVLLESATLHFAPCAVDEDGFRVAIVLPRGTNTPLDERQAGDARLWMKNKWLLAHRDAEKLVNAGAYVGLTGGSLSLKRS